MPQSSQQMLSTKFNNRNRGERIFLEREVYISPRTDLGFGFRVSGFGFGVSEEFHLLGEEFGVVELKFAREVCDFGWFMLL